MEKNTITYIPVEQLYPHPDNPRKDLGDLTELADSIKANGIFQNLTVVPYFSRIKGRVIEGQYTVIIGHRRLAAAQAAGLTEVPCVIMEMTDAEQLQTMLLENMQRENLTVYEQAKAFQQLTIDLGMTVQEIAERSGFSESTIRRRTKLAELDETAFKKACERGATLFDFAELDKIDEPEDRAKALDDIGTPNFKNTFRAIMDDQKGRKKLIEFEKVISTFATKMEKRGYLEEGGEFIPTDYVRNYGRWSSGEVIVPDDADTVKYYYFVGNYQIDLLIEGRPQDELDREREERERVRARAEAIREEAGNIADRHAALRKEFVKNLSVTKHNVVIIRNCAFAMLNSIKGGYYNVPDKHKLCDLLDLKYNTEAQGPSPEDFRALQSSQPDRLLMLMTYWFMERGQCYYSESWNSETQTYQIKYKANTDLDNLYYFLEELGYQRSDEERDMAYGRHRLFTKDPEDE